MERFEYRCVSTALRKFCTQHGGYFMMFTFMLWGGLDIFYGLLWQSNYCKSVSTLSVYMFAPLITPKFVVFAFNKGMLEMEEIDFTSLKGFKKTFWSTEKSTMFICAPFMFYIIKMIIIKILCIEEIVTELLYIIGGTKLQLLAIVVSLMCDFFQIQLVTTDLIKKVNKLDLLRPFAFHVLDPINDLLKMNAVDIENHVVGNIEKKENMETKNEYKKRLIDEEQCLDKKPFIVVT